MPRIDIAFEIEGMTIPRDHGPALDAALCRVVPQLRRDGRIGVDPIRGRRAGPGRLALRDASRLRVRHPAEQKAIYLSSVGRALKLGGSRIAVGMPRGERLTPSPSLASRLVIFEGVGEPADVLASVRRRLDERGVAGEPALIPSAYPARRGQPRRRALEVNGTKFVGFALRLRSLTAEESLSVQERGLRAQGDGVRGVRAGRKAALACAGSRKNPAGWPGRGIRRCGAAAGGRWDASLRPPVAPRPGQADLSGPPADVVRATRVHAALVRAKPWNRSKRRSLVSWKDDRIA
jgi:CRISPR-associated protein Cas6